MSEEELTRTFKEQRNRLLGMAYRLLGAVSDAEDALQEAWLRLLQSDLPSIRDPRPWLTKVLVRVCLDHLKSAVKKREVYTGPWLPEPLVAQLPAKIRSSALPSTSR